MTSGQVGSLGAVVCLVAEDSAAAGVIKGMGNARFEVTATCSVDAFLSKMNKVSDLVALVVENDVVDEACVGSLAGGVPEGFVKDGGPLLLMAAEDRGQDFQRIRTALNVCRIVDPGHGADALHGAISVEVEEFRLRQSVRMAVEAGTADIGDIEEATFRFRTREEAKNLATMLASSCQDRVPVAIGLTELFVNAVEHGCLKIGHGEKGRLIEKGRLADEIKYRRNLPEYSDRHVKVEFSRTRTEVSFRIVDPGEGFDHQSFLNSKKGHAKKHGRGITMAGGCFDELTYVGKGNEVIARHRLT